MPWTASVFGRTISRCAQIAAENSAELNRECSEIHSSYVRTLETMERAIIAQNSSKWLWRVPSSERDFILRVVSIFHSERTAHSGNVCMRAESSIHHCVLICCCCRID